MTNTNTTAIDLIRALKNPDYYQNNHSLFWLLLALCLSVALITWGASLYRKPSTDKKKLMSFLVKAIMLIVLATTTILFVIHEEHTKPESDLAKFNRVVKRLELNGLISYPQYDGVSDNNEWSPILFDGNKVGEYRASGELRFVDYQFDNFLQKALADNRIKEAVMNPNTHYSLSSSLVEDSKGRVIGVQFMAQNKNAALSQKDREKTEFLFKL